MSRGVVGVMADDHNSFAGAAWEEAELGQEAAAVVSMLASVALSKSYELNLIWQEAGESPRG